MKLGEIEFDWGGGGRGDYSLYAKKKCCSKAEIIHQFPEHHIPLLLFLL